MSTSIVPIQLKADLALMALACREDGASNVTADAPKLMETALEYIERLERRASGWVCVRDEPPPLREPVILYSLSGSMFIGSRYVGSQYNSDGLMLFHSPGYGKPRPATHWMKRPRSPGESEENNER